MRPSAPADFGSIGVIACTCSRSCSRPSGTDRRAFRPWPVIFLLEQFRLKLKRSLFDFSAHSLDRLVRYRRPGHVGELQNVIERTVILARSSTIEIDDQFLAHSEWLAEQRPRITIMS